MRVNGVEDKQYFLNKLVEALQETSIFGDTRNNTLVELRYLRDNVGNEIVRPIFKDGTGKDGYYDVNVNCDSCIAMLEDINRQFIRRVL